MDAPANYFSGMGHGHAGRDMDRGYDFTGVVRWLADRADVVLLFLDPCREALPVPQLPMHLSRGGYSLSFRVVPFCCDMLDDNWYFQSTFATGVLKLRR
jgi:hypothetical protein